MVCRVARSFVRFGSFQLPASRGSGEAPLARLLADHVIRHHFPHLQGAHAWQGAGLRRCLGGNQLSVSALPADCWHRQAPPSRARSVHDMHLQGFWMVSAVGACIYACGCSSMPLA